MNGKVLKVSSNDLYGNVDDRKVSVFAAFNHLKYMNRYVIFSFLDEYNKKKLYFGSVHLKDNSLVVFSIKDNNSINFVNKFITDYMSNKVDSNEFQIIDISNAEKIELVAFNTIDFEYLEQLDQMSIKREITNITNDTKSGNKGFLYVLLILLIGIAGGLTYLYFNPDTLTVELKKLECNMEGFNKSVDLNYSSSLEAKFDKEDKLNGINKVDIYKFENEEEYIQFKENNKERLLGIKDGGYTYDDDNLTLKVIYSDDLIIDSYDEVYEYVENEGYSCIEGTYNE